MRRHVHVYVIDAYASPAYIDPMGDAPLHTVIETPTYLRQCKETGVTEAERLAIVDVIAADPQAGSVIKGTGGARKVRIAREGKGKSGGYRVITFYADAETPVFLLSILSKGQRADLSQAERNALRTILGKIAGAYREGVAERIRRVER